MPDRDLDLLIEAALGSGEIALRYFRQDPQVWEKSDDAGPVTEADLAINAYLGDTLRAARPDYGWLSEETPDDSDRLATRRCFIVDPLDGTRAFINGQSGFAHSLAVAEDGKIVAGAVYLPEMRLLYAASADGPATLNDQPLRTSDGPLEDSSMIASRLVFDPVFWRDGEMPRVHRAFRPSLAWRLCLVAEGRFGATLALRRTWEWDVAAACLIAERAGCVVSDMTGAHPRFNNPAGSIDGIVVAGPNRQAEIVSRLAPPRHSSMRYPA